MTTKIGLGVPVPQLLPVTGTWALPFAAYNVFLLGRVSYQRKANKRSLENSVSGVQDASDPLYVATRAHATYAENVPFLPILSAIVELNGVDRRHLNAVLAALFAFRVVHVELGLRNPGSRGLGRLVGHLGTQIVYLILGVRAAWLARGYWGF